MYAYMYMYCHVTCCYGLYHDTAYMTCTLLFETQAVDVHHCTMCWFSPACMIFGMLQSDPNHCSATTPYSIHWVVEPRDVPCNACIPCTGTVQYIKWMVSRLSYLLCSSEGGNLVDHIWRDHVMHFTNTHVVLGFKMIFQGRRHSYSGSLSISKLASDLLPRYHFSASMNCNYERQPYRWVRVSEWVSEWVSKWEGGRERERET